LRQYTFYRLSSLTTVVNTAFVYWAMTRHGLMVVDIGQIRKASEVLFQNVSDGVVVTDRNGNIVQINDTARRLIPHVRALEDFSQIQEAFPEVHFSNRPSHVKHSYAMGDAGKTVIISHSPINERDAELGHITVFHDISEQKALEASMARKTQIESLGRLAGGIAHDFNNQLAGIMGCADILRTELSGNASQCELADIIVQSSRRSSRLTQQMLAFARKGKYQVVSLNVHDIISDVVSMLEHSIDKKIRILQHLDAQSPWVKADSSQLHTVFLNISLNSRDAMPHGGELLFQTRDITIGSDSILLSQFDIPEGRYVLIRMSDNGTGMAKSVLDRAFEPFFTTKKEGKGSGMGLSAAYGIIQSHAGAIAIESGEGRGTAVTIYLPSTTEAVPARDAEPERRALPQHLTILLVEDEALVAATAARTMEREGNRVLISKTGRNAIDRYSEHWREIDLIILDLILPDISGYEVFKSLKSTNPQCRVLLSSGYSVAGEAQRILDEGAAGFIQKPYESSALIRKIEETMAERS
jgi:signal transduction histidine kinase/CheY-like chemotaxis protein